MTKTSINFFIIFLILQTFVFTSACSTTTSVLVSKDDPVFDRAQENLILTIKKLAQINAPDEESTIFLQAESFYQYRYKPAPRGRNFYLISAASAITDFPGFQSMAGSLSLLDLRLRSSDSAVQLWETLLLRYPQTKLRALTLYRLGWAYRNVGASGLPHESVNELFEILEKEQPHAELAVLASEAKKIPFKSKLTATEKSLFPGLGQIYVGETKSGIIRMSIAAAALLAIAYPIYEASRQDREQTWDNNWPLLTLGLGGLIVLSFDYTNSYEDAMRGVVDWNERQENEFKLTHPEAP